MVFNLGGYVSVESGIIIIVIIGVFLGMLIESELQWQRWNVAIDGSRYKEYWYVFNFENGFVSVMWDVFMSL